MGLNMELPKNLKIESITVLYEKENGDTHKYVLLMNRPAMNGEYSITATGVVRKVVKEKPILWMDGRPTISGSENNGWTHESEIIK